jgi:hypothetical protein
MTEEQDTIGRQNLQNAAANKLLPFIAVCPQIIKSGTSVTEYLEELNEAAIKFNECTTRIQESISELLPFITVCPHIFKPETGLGTLVDELIKAASKFDLYFHIHEMKKD